MSVPYWVNTLGDREQGFRVYRLKLSLFGTDAVNEREQRIRHEARHGAESRCLRLKRLLEAKGITLSEELHHEVYSAAYAQIENELRAQ
jgi:hypothetical protein